MMHLDDSIVDTDDDEKFNRFFEDGDIMEENRKMMNESNLLVQQQKQQQQQRPTIDDDGGGGANNDDEDDDEELGNLMQIFDRILLPIYDTHPFFHFADSALSSTTTTTPTLSPYVQEIFNTNRFKNHHGKLKKKKQQHRRQQQQHHRKHYRDWDEGTIYTHPVNHHRARQQYHINRHREVHERRRQQPSYRTNYPQYQGRVSFYDDSNRLETRSDVDQYRDATTKDKWPYFAQVKTHLDDDMDDDLPPYLKKYKKRNRQLIDLLEGTLPPEPNRRKPVHKKHFHSHNKNARWLEEDLFEAQRPNRNGYSNKFIYEPPTTPSPNDLPGDNVHINPNSNSNSNNHFKHNLTISNHSLITNNHSPPFKISSRAGQFVYHTVTAVPSVTGGGNAIKKKRLPFVAITDRKIGPRKNTNNNNINNNEQNHLPMP